MDKPSAVRRLVPLAAGLAVAAGLGTATLAVHDLYQAHQQQQAESRALSSLYALRAELEAELATAGRVASGLAAWLGVEPEPDEEHFSRVADQLMGLSVPVRRAALAPDSRVALVHPLSDNLGLIGRDLRGDSSQTLILQALADGRGGVKLGPVTRMDGSTVLPLYAAVRPFEQDNGSTEHLGEVLVALDVELLARETGLAPASHGVDAQLTLTQNDEESTIGPEPDAAGAALRVPVQIPGGEGQLTATLPETGGGWLLPAGGGTSLALGLLTAFGLRRHMALKTAEQDARAVLDQLSDGACLIQEGRVRYANHRFRDITGYPEYELIGRDFPELLDPADRKRVQTHTGELEAGLPPMGEFNLRLRHSAGRSVYVRLNIAPAEWHGQPAAVATVADMDQRLRDAARLAESERIYREIVESAKAVVMRWRPGGELLSLNEAGQTLFGDRAEFSEAEPLWARLEPEQDAPDALSLARVGSEPESYPTSEGSCLDQTGEPRWLVWNHCPLYHEDGRLREILSVGTDCTRQRNAAGSLRHREQRLRAITDHAPEPMVLIRADGTIGWLSPAWARTLGQDPEGLRGRPWTQLLDEAERPRAERLARAILEGERESLRETFRSRDARDKQRWLLVHLAPAMGDPDGPALTGMLTDITDQKAAVRELELAGLAYQHSPLGLYVADPEGRIISANPAFQALVGGGAEGRRLEHLTSGRERHDFHQRLTDTLSDGRPWSGDLECRRGEGPDDLWIQHTWLAPVIDPDDGLTHRVGIAEDATEQRASEAAARERTLRDPLTGLASPDLLQDRLAHAIERARAEQGQLAVLCLDLDDFGALNQRLGERETDAVLARVAGRVKQQVPDSETLARLEDDTLVVVLERLGDPAEAGSLAGRLLQAIAEPMLIGADEVQVTASLGLSLYPDHGVRPEDLIDAANQCIPEAKAAGKNTWRQFRSRGPTL